MPIAHYKNETPKKYNPQNTSNEVLKKTFSIRLKEYDKIWKDITESKMETPEQSYIIQGVRGSGKTTLLTRLVISIEEDEKLSQWLIPIQFKEEEYGINSLFSFWARIAEDLEEHYQHSGLFYNLVDTIESIEDNEEKYDIEAKSAFSEIEKKLKNNNKKIILFIDNIVELFQTFSTKEKEILREILSQNNNIRIIGGSSISLEPFYDHKEPFYQFFKLITLKKLTKKETINLLKSLGKTAGKEEFKRITQVIKEEPEKIESIRRLTGGIPRTIALLFDILAEGPKGSTFQYLDHTLDMASPIYKHRMDDLSAQQQPIIHAIAKHWDAISAKEISEKTRLSSKTVSAQLTQLQKQWLVEKIPTGTKNHLYRLDERFFNIWYLMRYGRRRDKTKMLWLTQFLEIWCTPEELMYRAKNYQHELTKDSYLPGALAYSSALLACKSIGIEEKEAVYNTTYSFFNDQGGEDFLKQLPEIDNKEYILKSREFYDKGDFTNAINYLYKSIDNGNTRGFLLAGYIYHEKIKDFEKAEKNYIKSLEHNHHDAYLNLGNLYADDLELFEKAEFAYQQAIENNDTRAYILLGILYSQNLNEFDKAENAFSLGVKNNEHDGYICLGFLYSTHYNDYKKAETAFIKAIEHEKYDAYIYLADMYVNKLQKFGEAKTAYLQAIKHKQYQAYTKLAVLYANEYQDITKAKDLLIKAVELKVDGAINKLAWLYFTSADTINKDVALEYAQSAVASNRHSDELHTLACNALWHNDILLAKECATEILEGNCWQENSEFAMEVVRLLVLFLAKEQTNLVDQWLKGYQLADQFKPLYYALMHLMKDKYPNEYLRMGSELEETVSEILEEIETLKEKYS